MSFLTTICEIYFAEIIIAPLYSYYNNNDENHVKVCFLNWFKLVSQKLRSDRCKFTQRNLQSDHSTFTQANFMIGSLCIYASKLHDRILVHLHKQSYHDNNQNVVLVV
jgi:hypothetical protein